MTKPIIAVDIDDVLADSTEALRLEVNKRLGVNLQPEHYKVPGDYQNYYETVWESHELSDRITMDDLGQQMEIGQSHLKLQTGAKRALRKLSKHYELLVVTSRDESWRLATEAWLESHFGKLFTEVIFTNSTSNSEQLTKGQVCAQKGVSWLIDDNVEHAQSALDKGIQVVLYGDYGWHHKIPAGMTRCKDWAAAEVYFEGRAS